MSTSYESCPNRARYGHRMLVTSEPQKLRRRVADPSEITPELLKVRSCFDIRETVDAQNGQIFYVTEPCFRITAVRTTCT